MSIVQFYWFSSMAGGLRLFDPEKAAGIVVCALGKYLGILAEKLRGAVCERKDLVKITADIFTVDGERAFPEQGCARMTCDPFVGVGQKRAVFVGITALL